MYIFVAITANGQHYYFKQFQAEDGLAHNTVFSLIQDKSGFLWIGTKGGLNRFDGNKLKNFNDKNSLFSIFENNQIQALCEDKTGLIWIGTSNGLYYYNPFNETFEKPEAAKDIGIDRILCDDQNILWFTSSDVIFQYNHQKKELHQTDWRATSFSFDDSGNLWFGNRKGQLNKLDIRTKKVSTFQVVDPELTGRSKTVSKVLASGKHILIGTQTQGFKIFDTTLEKTIPILSRNNNGTEVYVRDIIEGRNGDVWIATESGIFRYNLKSDKLSNIKKRVGDPYSLSDNAVYTLCQDNHGGIWAGTFFGGLNYLSQETSKFEKYYPLNSSNSISGNAVREISSYDGKKIWIGTEDAGLNLFDSEKGTFTHFTADGKSFSLSYPNIHGLLAEKNKVFVGPFIHGLEVMDILSGKVTQKFPLIKAERKPYGDFVMSILRTSDQRLLIGTTGAGLFEFNEQQQQFTKLTQIPPNSYINALLEDHSGTIWTGSHSLGTFYFNFKTKEQGNVRFYGKQGKQSESDFSIQGILEDKYRNLWFTTEGGGLICLNKDRRSFRKYTTKDGLPTNYLYRALEDEEGFIWISSLKGLICLNPKTSKVTVYTQSNGLLTDQFNYNSAYKDPHGKMYFGSVKGMIAFNPSLFNKPLPTPPVYITNLQIDNLDVIPGKEDSPLKKSILNTDTIILNYKQTSFNLEFTAVSFTSPDVIRYRYKMEGLDKSWTYLTNNRKAYFTDLSPGDYTFRVLAESNVGSWPPQEKTIFIRVLPPFWKSLPAIIFYIALFILVLYLSIRYYQRHLELKNRRRLQLFELAKEREVYHAKIEFFTTIAHEIQTPLTLIKGPIGWAIEKIGNTPLKKSLQMVEKNTDRLMDLSRHLLDFRKAEANQFGLNFVNVNISDLLQEQVESFKAEAERKGLFLELQLPPEPFTAFVDKEAFIKISSNLLSNAIKYGDRSVKVTLMPVKTGEDFFNIHFSNDGETIPTDEQGAIFQPFKRAANGKDKAGTGIGLSLAKSLTELHNGKLNLITSANGVTIFELHLPIHQKFEFILGK